MRTQQNIEALQKGNRIRLAKAALKRDLKQQPTLEALAELADRVETWDETILPFRLRDLSMAVHGFGRKKARRFAEYVGCSEDDRISELDDEELERLVLALRRPRLVMPGSGL